MPSISDKPPEWKEAQLRTGRFDVVLSGRHVTITDRTLADRSIRCKLTEFWEVVYVLMEGKPLLKEEHEKAGR